MSRTKLYIVGGLLALVIVCITILEWQRRSLAAAERDRELKLQEEQVRPRKLWERER